MNSRVAILLGRSVWTCGSGGWGHRSFDEGSGATAPAISHLAKYLSEEPPARTVLVYEPGEMAHQAVESPNSSRSVFASLAKVRNDHPVVLSEFLGWGIESPEPIQGGAFSTLLHSELAPGLVHLRDACVRGGSSLVAAWPAYTAAVACMKSCAASQRTRFVVILTAGFTAVATCGGGKRMFKGWVGPMLERDWRTFSTLIGDFEARSSPSMAEVVLRRGGIAVISDGEPKGICPIWSEIRASGRLEAVVNIEAFAASARQIPLGHPANMETVFPRPLRLNRYLASAAFAGLSATTVIGALDMRQRSQLSAEREAYHIREASLTERLATLASNQKEMTALRDQAPEGSALLHAGRHVALLDLASEVPDTLTLNSFTISSDNTFEIEAVVVGTSFDPEGLRLALERNGFKPSDPNGWAFNSKSGSLSIRGLYGSPRT